MPLFRRNTEKNSKMCKRDGVTFKVTPPFFKDFYHTSIMKISNQYILCSSYFFGKIKNY